MVTTDYRKRTKPWYGTARWQKLRKAHLASEPLCRYCKQAGRITPATVCDHIEPHKGDEAKFWAGPFQSLCASCHNSTAQSLEKGGKPKPITGLDGWPVEQSDNVKEGIKKKTGR